MLGHFVLGLHGSSCNYYSSLAVGFGCSTDCLGPIARCSSNCSNNIGLNYLQTFAGSIGSFDSIRSSGSIHGLGSYSG